MEINTTDEIDDALDSGIPFSAWDWYMRFKGFGTPVKDAPRPLDAHIVYMDRLKFAIVAAVWDTMKQAAHTPDLNPFTYSQYVSDRGYAFEVVPEIETRDEKTREFSVVPGRITVSETPDKVHVFPLKNGVTQFVSTHVKMGDRKIAPFNEVVARLCVLAGSLLSLTNSKIKSASLQAQIVRHVGLGTILNPDRCETSVKVAALLVDERMRVLMPQLFESKTGRTAYGTAFCDIMYQFFVALMKSDYKYFMRIVEKLFISPFNRPCVLMDMKTGQIAVNTVSRATPPSIGGVDFDIEKRTVTFSQAYHLMTDCRNQRGSDEGEVNSFARMATLGIMLHPTLVEVLYLARDLMRFVGNYKTVILYEAGDLFMKQVIEALAGIGWAGLLVCENKPGSLSRFPPIASDKLNRRRFGSVLILPVVRVNMGLRGVNYAPLPAETDGYEWEKPVIYDCRPGFKLGSWEMKSDAEYTQYFNAKHKAPLFDWSISVYPVFGMAYCYPNMEKLLDEKDPLFFFKHSVSPQWKLNVVSAVRAHNLSCYVSVGVELSDLLYLDTATRVVWWYDLISLDGFKSYMAQSVIFNLARMQFSYTGVTPGRWCNRVGLERPPLGGKLMSQVRVVQQIDKISLDVLNTALVMSPADRDIFLANFDPVVRAAISADIREQGGDIVSGGGGDELSIFHPLMFAESGVRTASVDIDQ